MTYRIQKICKDYGVVEPAFEEVADGFRVVVFNEKLNTKENTIEKVGEKLTDNQQLILDCISQDNKISAVRIAEIVGISARKVEENIRKLKEKGFIDRIGPAKGGYWKVIKE